MESNGIDVNAFAGSSNSQDQRWFRVPRGPRFAAITSFAKQSVPVSASFRADLSHGGGRVTLATASLEPQRVNELKSPHFRSRTYEITRPEYTLRLLPSVDSICALPATAHNGSFRVNKAEQKEIKTATRLHSSPLGYLSHLSEMDRDTRLGRFWPLAVRFIDVIYQRSLYIPTLRDISFKGCFRYNTPSVGLICNTFVNASPWIASM